jgi:hypothetical protein
LIPLFDGEKQQKTLLQTLRRPTLALQIIDYIRENAKFRYAAEQRNLAADQRK